MENAILGRDLKVDCGMNLEGRRMERVEFGKGKGDSARWCEWSREKMG